MTNANRCIALHIQSSIGIIADAMKMFPECRVVAFACNGVAMPD